MILSFFEYLYCVPYQSACNDMFQINIYNTKAEH